MEFKKQSVLFTLSSLENEKAKYFLKFHTAYKLPNVTKYFN